ncbi:MAG TPA: hypothetical protein VFB69_05385 [Candidatus Dormibacteraeota bacterium]|nr:hypothetical protein [Candidatus Dormibacteraeota bacterium]
MRNDLTSAEFFQPGDLVMYHSTALGARGLGIVKTVSGDRVGDQLVARELSVRPVENPHQTVPLTTADITAGPWRPVGAKK